MSSTKLSEAATLELYRVALENVEKQPEITAIMTELGYDSNLIGNGKTLLKETREAFDAKKTEDDEKSDAYADFSAKKEQLQDVYNLHRKKAKVIFRNDPLTQDKLKISGALPRSYMKWLEAVRTFYNETLADTNIQSKLVRLKISEEGLTTANTMITNLESARALYLKEKGESQDSTKTKDAAFEKMDDWMSEFFAVARIGLEDQPQLLEVLGKTVKG